MSAPQAPTLVIADGGLPALVALAIEAERAAAAGPEGGGPPALVMPWITTGGPAEAQLAAISSQARFFGQTVLEPAPVRTLADGASRAFLASLGLLVALEAARINGCRAIVWPFHTHATDETLPGQLDAIAAAADRAILISRLATLDPPAGGGPPPAIDTPLADLTTRQVADLAIDLDAPVYLAWWWRPPSEEGPARRAAIAEGRLWRPVLAEAGWISAAPGVHVNAPDPATRLDPGPGDSGP